jgi:hypothetical protein
VAGAVGSKGASGALGDTGTDGSKGAMGPQGLKVCQLLLERKKPRIQMNNDVLFVYTF